MADGVELPGPWRHQHVAANGARFHVAQAGPEQGPLVLLLHGFAEFWWTWRHQIPALADAGFRVAAMDLRGCGSSDRTPRGYDPMTLAQDVSSVVKTLGRRDAIVVGHGWGGYVGWSAAAMHPAQVSALCTVSAPHPTAMLASARRHPASPGARHLMAMQVPVLPARRWADPHGRALGRHLRAWSATESSFPSREEVATYQKALVTWPSSQRALQYHRWLVRSRLRADGRRFDRLMRPTIAQPVLLVRGALDCVLPVDGYARTRRHLHTTPAEHLVAGVGHYPHEEVPEAFTEILLDWLA